MENQYKTFKFLETTYVEIYPPNESFLGLWTYSTGPCELPVPAAALEHEAGDSGATKETSPRRKYRSTAPWSWCAAQVIC